MGACVGSWDAGRPRWACTQRPPFRPAQEASPLDGTATRRAARPLVSNAPLPSWEHNNLSWAGGGGCGRRHLETRSPRCAGDILASARPAVGKPPFGRRSFFPGGRGPREHPLLPMLPPRGGAAACGRLRAACGSSNPFPWAQPCRLGRLPGACEPPRHRPVADSRDLAQAGVRGPRHKLLLRLYFPMLAAAAGQPASLH